MSQPFSNLSKLKGSNSNAGASSSGSRGGMGVGSILLAVIGIVVILLVIYFVMTALVPQSGDAVVLINSPEMTSKNDSKKTLVIKDPMSPLVATYTGWIYVDNYIHNFGRRKPIFWRGSSGEFAQIFLDNDTNELVFLHKIRSFDGNNSNFQCRIKEVPLQTWVNFTIVLNSRNVDIYINGRLERSCVMDGVPISAPTTAPIVYGFPESKTFMGQIARLYYYGRNLSPTEIFSNYSKGPFPDTSFTLF